MFKGIKKYFEKRRYLKNHTCEFDYDNPKKWADVFSDLPVYVGNEISEYENYFYKCKVDGCDKTTELDQDGNKRNVKYGFFYNPDNWEDEHKQRREHKQLHCTHQEIKPILQDGEPRVKCKDCDKIFNIKWGENLDKVDDD
jgi:hypothetical protein